MEDVRRHPLTGFSPEGRQHRRQETWLNRAKLLELFGKIA